jgi:hypothetical protein
MEKVIDLLEKAVREAGRVEVLGIVDREYLDRAIGHIREVVNELQKEAGG